MRISDWSSDVCSSDLAGAKLAQFARQIGHVRADFAALPLTRIMARIDAIGRSVLTDDEQFLRPRRDQLFGLAQHRVDTAADQFAAQIRDDTEGTAMVAALRNLQIAVVARGELQDRKSTRLNSSH